jgi:hypothetical protein
MQNLEQFKPAQCIVVAQFLAFPCCLEHGVIPFKILFACLSCFWGQYLSSSIKMYLKITTLIKKKIKFSSYVREFRMERLQSHI